MLWVVLGGGKAYGYIKCYLTCFTNSSKSHYITSSGLTLIFFPPVFCVRVFFSVRFSDDYPSSS